MRSALEQLNPIIKRMTQKSLAGYLPLALVCARLILRENSLRQPLRGLLW